MDRKQVFRISIKLFEKYFIDYTSDAKIRNIFFFKFSNQKYVHFLLTILQMKKNLSPLLIISFRSYFN